MTGIDTNVLARFYVDDPSDDESVRQRPLARAALADPAGVFVPITVILELEWVLRAFYGFDADAFAGVIEHLVGLPNAQVEDRTALLAALDLHRLGLDLADALHVLRSPACDRFVTFDDRRFARRARRAGVMPAVVVLR